MRLSLALSFLILFSAGASVQGQGMSARPAQPDTLDIKAYRTLFRRDLMLIRLADASDLTNEPKPYLRKLLKNRFSLSEVDSATLDRLSLNYQQEVDPLEAKVLLVVQQFKAKFPAGVIPRDVIPSPTPELTDLQREQDAIVLRYRDQLRNSMSENEFQKLHSQVQKAFAMQGPQ